MAPLEPHEAADWFLHRAKRDNKSLTPMQVLKLVYFAHGWHLAIHKEPLINEPIQAWKFGPVVASLYHEFKKFGAGPIKVSGSPVQLDSSLEPLLERIWNVYGHLSARELSDLTHVKGSPWWEANDSDHRDYGALTRDRKISNAAIRKYFEDLALRRKAAAKPITPA